MMINYLKFGVSIAVISWIVGMIVNAILRKTTFYSKTLSNLNFIKSEYLNKCIGLGFFKWIVKNTFFKFFNQKLKLKRKIEIADLNYLYSEMITAEISHLIGFVFVSIFVVVAIFNFHFLFGLIIMVVNVLMNLYPSLLQQENKRRIEKLKKKMSLTKEVVIE